MKHSDRYQPHTQTSTDNDSPDKQWLSPILWFFGLWLVGVATLAIVAYTIRWITTSVFG